MTAAGPAAPQEREAAAAALAQRTNARIVEAEAWSDARGIVAPPEETVQRAKALEHRLADLQSKQRRKQGASKSTGDAVAAPASKVDEPMPFVSLDNVDPTTGEIVDHVAGDQAGQVDEAGIYSEAFPVDETGSDFGVPDDVVAESARLYAESDSSAEPDPFADMPEFIESADHPAEPQSGVPDFVDDQPVFEASESAQADSAIPSASDDELELEATWAELKATQESESDNHDHREEDAS